MSNVIPLAPVFRTVRAQPMPMPSRPASRLKRAATLAIIDMAMNRPTRAIREELAAAIDRYEAETGTQNTEASS